MKNSIFLKNLFMTVGLVLLCVVLLGGVSAAWTYRYITGAEPGCGLIRYGSVVVPFENHFPKDTKLYQLMTTRPGEGDFAGDRAS